MRRQRLAAAVMEYSAAASQPNRKKAVVRHCSVEILQCSEVCLPNKKIYKFENFWGQTLDNPVVRKFCAAVEKVNIAKGRE